MTTCIGRWPSSGLRCYDGSPLEHYRWSVLERIFHPRTPPASLQVSTASPGLESFAKYLENSFTLQWGRKSNVNVPWTYRKLFLLSHSRLDSPRIWANLVGVVGRPPYGSSCCLQLYVNSIYSFQRRFCQQERPSISTARTIAWFACNAVWQPKL